MPPPLGPPSTQSDGGGAKERGTAWQSLFTHSFSAAAALCWGETERWRKTREEEREPWTDPHSGEGEKGVPESLQHYKEAIRALAHLQREPSTVGQ